MDMNGNKYTDSKKMDKVLKNYDPLFIQLPGEIITITYDDDTYIIAGKSISSLREFDTVEDLFKYISKTYIKG